MPVPLDVTDPREPRVPGADDAHGEPDFKEVVWALPVAMYTTDLEGNITLYNQAAVELWGSESKPGAAPFGGWSLCWPDGRPMRRDESPMAVTLRTGEPTRGGEAMAARRDGARIPLIPYSAPLHDAAGRLIGAVAILVDIPERKEFEQAIRAHARRLEVLNDVAKVISSDLDLARVSQSVTDLAVEASGAGLGAFFRHETDELGTPTLVKALSPRDGIQELEIDTDSALFAATVRDGALVRASDIRKDPRYRSSDLCCRVGSERVDVASYLAVPVGRRGDLKGALFLAHPAAGVFGQEAEDIVSGTAAHAAIAIDNARLYEAERRLAEVVATSSDAIVRKDIRGIVRSWNGAAERLFGYTADEMIGKPIALVIPPDRIGEEEAILSSIRRGMKVEPYETVRVRKDGMLVDISVSVSPLRDAKGRVVGASKIARDITERKQALARQDLLAREVHHRTKNLFAVINAVVARSFAGKETVEEAEAAVRHRLHSLAQMHVMLLDQGWKGADLGEVVRAEMRPYEERVSIDGPQIMLSAQAAQNFSLALHELATNAAKHGALSKCTGRVWITWSVSPSSAQQFVFRWQERGGPAVCAPVKKGFGSTVLEHVMAEYVEGSPRIEFAPEGFTYEFSGPLKSIVS